MSKIKDAWADAGFQARKINPPVVTRYHGGGAPDIMSPPNKQLELPNTEDRSLIKTR